MPLHHQETIYAATPSGEQTWMSSDGDGLYYGIMPTKLDELRVVMEDLPEDRRVLYVGSDRDISPVTYFGREHVDHVDISAGPVQALKRRGHTAVLSAAHDFAAEPYDIVLIINTHTISESDISDRLLKPGGYMIATPSSMLEMLVEEGELTLIETVEAASPTDSFGPHFMESKLLLLRKPGEPIDASS